MIQIECDNNRQVQALVDMMEQYSKQLDNTFIIIDPSHPLWEITRRQMVLWKIRRDKVQVRRKPVPIVRKLSPSRRYYEAPIEWSEAK